MRYAVTFIEGVMSFVSPCMLPMLPLYISYFAAGDEKKHKVFLRALCFVLGFTLVFSLFGLFAGTLGSFLVKYRTAVNIVCGVIVIFFGLNYLGLFKLPFFKGMDGEREAGSLVGAFIFGAVYSVSLTPCVGAFLGAALALAANSSSAIRGVLLLAVYSLGIGVPFVISALLIDKLKGAFGFIKRHYKVINTVCGVFLIAVGLLIAFGGMGALMSLLG